MARATAWTLLVRWSRKRPLDGARPHTMRTLTPVFFCLLTLPAAAQDSYQLPPKAIVDIASAAPPPATSVSPDQKWILSVERDAMPSIQDISRRMLKLAGMRIDPVACAPFRSFLDKSLSIRPLTGGSSVNVPVPGGARLSGVAWSHASSHFMFTVLTEGGTQLWIADVRSPESPRKVTDHINSVSGRGFIVSPDGRSILCKVNRADRGPEPPAPAAPSGPNIQETSGTKSPVRTYQDLLTNAYDESLLEYYITSQLMQFSVNGGEGTAIGKPGMILDVEYSPDGKHLLVDILHKPFSYLMPISDFPNVTEVWSSGGNREYEVVKNGLAENIPIEGVRTGRRNVGWKTGEPATLLWLEALDGGDPKRKADARDKIVTLAAPFTGTPVDILTLQHRARGIQYTSNPDVIIATDYDRDRKWTRTRMFDLKNRDAKPVVLDDRNMSDRYNDPGAVLTTRDATGRAILLQHGDYIYRAGAGATPEGERPFFARHDLKTGAREELWRCGAGEYESVVDIVEPLDGASPRIITRHESPTSPPNLRIRTTGPDAKITAITNDPDPTPQIRGIKKQLVKYKRADGVDLSATMYLPADYKEGTRLPMLVWAYPLEYTDSSTAGQVSGSPNRFTRMAGISHLFLVTQGYAVMDNATMPIVGNPETMNDTFIEQITAAAKAAIDKADEMGVADRSRVAVGGHSYGAFMTANLLAHTDLFKTGIARSGAYNRTLTPFGFQSERRTLWEAPKIYQDVSPFMAAHKINEPILMIHGENDSNPGTFPIQSQRLFAAIKGNGGNARLVMLPKEDHGYSARESVLHVHAEMVAWLDKYVKNAPAPQDAGAKR